MPFARSVTVSRLDVMKNELTETQEDDEEGNEIDQEEDDEGDENDENGVEGEGPREEKEELRRKKARFDKRGTLLKEKEALKKERDELNERAQLKREKDLFFEDKEKLAKEREEFNKEKEDSHTRRERFVMEEEGEELRKRREINDIEKKELGYGDLDVQSYSIAEGNVLDASTSHLVYQRRTKRLLNPSYYKVSPYLSMSAFDTTPGEVPKPEQVTAFVTSQIPFPLQMDPFRILSAQEVKEAED
ncbi:vicilin-like seed storage protein At2g18540 [Magnolia sinica]|uniref:vicilin-like seed storage protein At2g18540 n=1 Tax=Magnolia sinica TaxID=86752 RepID=UPI00265981AD|nr:vicilin-like seed storage protein At2g18540 [Magnolia sinica]